MAFLQVELFSHALHMAVTVDVLLPQPTQREIGIDSGSNTGSKYPVLWLLHGASDDHTTWQRRTSIERYVASMGLAVVMPSAHLSSYANMAHGGDFYNYIVDELPTVLRTFFPLSAVRKDNYIAGNSMGGYGAMKIGINNPQSYSAIGCFSAGANSASSLRERVQEVDPLRRMRNAMVYGDKNLSGTIEDTLYIAQKNSMLPELPRVFHSCGSGDFLLEKAHATRDFFLSLKGNPYHYIYEEHEGVHEWDYWDRHIVDFLQFIQRQ